MTDKPIELLIDGPQKATATLVLAHGAGAAMDTPFMERIARSVAARRIRVVRFEFPYMVRRRETGTRRPPDRMPVLRERWLAVVATLGDPGGLVIGGKSMGGRVASMIADEIGARGLVCLGYPYHPPGRPDRLRTEHLAGLLAPALFVQGSRDALGNRDEVESYALSPSIQCLFLEDGDHSFKPRVRSGLTHEAHLDAAAEAVAGFVSDLSA